MYGYFIKLTLFLLLTFTLQAKDGLSQEHILSLTPLPLAQNISADTSVEIEFDSPIIIDSIRKNSITLKREQKHKDNRDIEGITTIKNSTTLLFRPNENLKSGTYKVKVKKIKLRNEANKKIYKDKDATLYKVCNYLCDDIDDCILPKCGKKAIKTKKIKYTFSVDENIPQVVSLTLNKSNIELNEDNTTTISVNAKYDDNSSINVTDDVEWIMSDSNIISIDKNIITPKNEGITTLQAKYNNQLTTKISITVYKEINGYKLPPEPDETLNNSTLLGIDSNDNGVRDDVERKIVETYREPIKIELMMDMAEVGQMILENPIGDAIVNQKKISRIGDCGMYLRRQKQRPSNSIDFYEKSMYNTKQRVRAYLDYNQALSGGVYGSSPADWKADSCDYDVDAMLGVK